MIWIAIALQLILSVGLLCASWQVWMFRNALQSTVKTVDGWTEACENGLQGSTPGLEVARGGVGIVREQYQVLHSQLEKIRKLLSVLARGVSFLGSRWQQSRKGASKGASNSLNNKPNGKSNKRSSASKSSGSNHNVKRRR
ncbi:hypothetical protein B9G53_11065 [Pseudanabaena sp. SR411]|uniref:hypothetical protein n=1 Tax=Pseudanabaena sp. SR411 TaxID=1980935 RepID=UPI000B99960F|nr:hypothetical protein [Pseudanabaena sp. SR411]OYQ64564.1 hypothetical protein B9G53_11065 [Pseudanabaena sp. SR411]